MYIIIPMQKDKVILYVIVAFLVGFIVGAVVAIKWYARERPSAGMSEQHQDGGAPARLNATEEIRQLEGVLQKDPQNLQALVSLGNLYFDTNQSKKAIEAYERALQIDPKNPDVRTDLGIMYRQVKDYDRAIKEFREAARLDPTHKNSRFNLGVVLQHDKKDVKGAIQAWEDFLRVEPTGERSDMVRKELAQLKSLAQ
jgi:cytochrome c-type biogenesis protein CcmH/NrfG